MVMAIESKHFKKKELACRCCGFVNVQQEALDKLEMLRSALGRPLIVNSASRCPDHNRAVGSNDRSQHYASPVRQSTAFDIAVELADMNDFVKAADMVGFKGIGIYRGNGFVHVDNRERKARW
jgi:uncharacterized protein YcbK (DUF882 family)